MEAQDVAITPVSRNMNNCIVCSKPCKTTYCSLSCSNVGRLPKNIAKYDLNPKRCPQCEAPIDYHKRFESVYCSHSCAASANNVTRLKKPKKTKPNISKHTQTLERFEQGLIKFRSTLRSCLKHMFGENCAICNLPPCWESKKLILVVDHIDGDASNNFPSNLRLLCPNCNSQTDTFCGRNKGKGRGSRGLSKN